MPPKTSKEPSTPGSRRPIAQTPLPGAEALRTGTPDTPELYTPKIRKAIGSTEISPFVEEAKSAKRNFSEVSASSAEAIQAAKTQKTHGREGSKEFNRFINEKTGESLDAAIQCMETDLKAHNEALRSLNEQWRAGDLKCTNQHYDDEVKRLESLIRSKSSNVVVARTSQHEIQGAITDTQVWLDGKNVLNWGYIDLLISRYRSPEGAMRTLSNKSREPSAQERFRKRVLKEYGAKLNEAQSRTAVWCVVSAEYHTSGSIAAAHVVRYNVGEVAARQLFGKPESPDGHLMSPHNGIPMMKEYEEAFDRGRLVFVPVESGESGEWEISVLDKKLLEEDGKSLGFHWAWGKDLDGRRLRFRNGFRPKKRYMYAAWCLNIFRRQRCEVEGWWKDKGLIEREMWASPGECIRRSTLVTLAHQVGHLSEDEAKRMAGTFEPIVDNQQSDVKDGVVSASVLKSTGGPERENELVSQGDEDSDDDVLSIGRSSKSSNRYSGLLQIRGKDEDADKDEDPASDDE
ncbi:hypothetical protein F4779DRAFT_636598 [Xylariaceae sp. FL0662B]|nr:hypothetical protein F4779DRAFT_636598 [Xylariaceae sp. FL0662B]